MTLAIQAEDLAKLYRIGEYQAAYGTLRETLSHAAKRAVGREHERPEREIWALRDVSFELAEGHALGVIGPNGAGKSTLLKILTRITTPTKGQVEIRGRVGSLLEVGTGFHPELTGRENVYLNGAVLGMKRRDIARRYDEIVDFSGVGEFMDTPVKRYSSGMHVRLAFAVAAHLEPEVLLVDEVLAVGDAEFQRRCLGRMEEFGQSGRTVLFVSHNLQAVARLCDRTILLDHGSVVLDGPSPEVVGHYLQTGYGAGSYRQWLDNRSAPGDDAARLRSVRVVQHGETAEAVDVRYPVGIEIAFVVLRPGVALFPKIKVLTAEGDVVFNALDTDPRWHGPAAPGEYVSTAWIPGNLFNEGFVSVDASIVSLGPKLEPHAGIVSAVAFNVYDPGEGDSSRGLFTGRLRGPLRPLLEWTTAEL